MVFSALFLPVTFLLYFATKNPKIRNAVLLTVSLLFYAWGEPKWIFVMLLTVTVNYFCGLLIDSSESKFRRTVCMVTGVALSLGFLFYFKYFGFFSDIIMGLLGRENPFTKPVLPIGISFYTFQVLTYTVDVYRRKERPQKRFSTLLLYVCCFPQLIAGPIVQYGDIAQQLGKRSSTADGFSEGMQRFMLGLGKKVIFANICGSVMTAMPLAGGGVKLTVIGAWYAAFMYAL